MINPPTMVMPRCVRRAQRGVEGEAGKRIKVQVQGAQEPPHPIAHTHLTEEESEAQELE